MAFSAVWITVASLVAVFDISKAVDEDGNVIEPSHEYESALVVYVSRLTFCDAPSDVLSVRRYLSPAPSNLGPPRLKR